MNTTRTFLINGLSALMALTLVGCGGSSDSAVAGNQPPPAATAQTTVGQITGFGSVYVNGVEYDTVGTNYDVDDELGNDDGDLAVGMTVKIQGSVNSDGRTGKADSISYDDDIEGIVERLAQDLDDPNIKTFTVMDVLIRVDENSTNFEGEDDPGFNFESIMDGDNVEISGEFSGDVLIASYVEKQDALDDDFEAKGIVSAFNNVDQFVLTLKTGSMLDVTVAPGAEIPSTGIANDQYVEVEGTIPDPAGAPNAMLATKVEIEDEDRLDESDNDEIEIKGVLSYDMDSDTWSVKGVTVAFGDDTTYKPESLLDSIGDLSADGLYVEVEGQYVSDVLQVEEIELEEDELEFKADVAEIVVNDARDGTLTLTFGVATGMLEVVVTPETMFRDDDAMEHFDLNSLMNGDKVEVEARLADDGVIYASNLRLEDNADYEIKGPLDEIDELSLTVLGIEFGVDSNTFFENGVPVVGDNVEVEDDGDGIADSVEIDD